MSRGDSRDRERDSFPGSRKEVCVLGLRAKWDVVTFVSSHQQHVEMRWMDGVDKFVMAPRSLHHMPI